MRARRAILIMPGDSPRKIEKGAGLDVDAIMIDLEDGVAPTRKDGARATTRDALERLDFGATERLVRVNAVGSGMTAADVHETIDGRPDGYVVPKVESAGQVAYLDHLLTDLEAERGWERGALSLQLLIESARGLVRIHEIAAASPRLTALQFGSEDLAGDMGLTRTTEEWELLTARAQVAIAASAAGLQAIDGVTLDFRDREAAARGARRAVEMGYDGKLAIHPDQVAPLHEAFTPSDEAIAAARRLVEAVAAQAERGVGVFALDGRMIDPAIVRPAERLLERARAAGKLVD